MRGPEESYIAYWAAVPDWMVQAAELTTIALSIVGLFVSLMLTNFFGKDSRTLSQRLRSEYFTDFLGFVVLLVMGYALFFNMPWLVKIDVIVRPFVVLLNILAMVRLYLHYRKL